MTNLTGLFKAQWQSGPAPFCYSPLARVCHMPMPDFRDFGVAIQLCCQKQKDQDTQESLTPTVLCKRNIGFHRSVCHSIGKSLSHAT